MSSKAQLLTYNDQQLASNTTGAIQAVNARNINYSVIQNLYLPVGVILPFVGTFTNPTQYQLDNNGLNYYKWLLCDGSLVSSYLYDPLYRVVGVRFGYTNPGTPDEHFAIPDLRQKIIVGGQGPSDGPGYSVFGSGNTPIWSYDFYSVGAWQFFNNAGNTNPGIVQYFHELYLRYESRN